MKNILLISIIILFPALLALAGCSSCNTNESKAAVVDLVNFELTVTDPDGKAFMKNMIPDSSVRHDVFELSSNYTRPGESLPGGLRNVYFFYRFDALPNSQSIFEQKAGVEFTVGKSVGQNLDESLVVYREDQPTLDPKIFITWKPTSYDGNVTFPKDNQVQLDLTFTDGVQSRHVLALYNFVVNTGSTQSGNCD
ncbi:MAG: hypothetical protein U1F57_01835 [bacterium]